MRQRPLREKYLKLKNSPTHFCSLVISARSCQISQNSVNSMYPINSFKGEGLFRKTSASFHPQRFVKRARLIREICQHEKPPGNEIAEPPSFTVSKQELRGKAVVVVTFSTRTLLGGSHQWGKQKQSNGFCFRFNPRTFLFPRTFHVHEMISIATRTRTRVCKQKILIS